MSTSRILLSSPSSRKVRAVQEPSLTWAYAQGVSSTGTMPPARHGLSLFPACSTFPLKKRLNRTGRLRTLWDPEQRMTVLGLSLLPVSVSLGVGPGRPQSFPGPKSTNSPVAGSMWRGLPSAREVQDKGGRLRQKDEAELHVDPGA